MNIGKKAIRSLVEPAAKAPETKDAEVIEASASTEEIIAELRSRGFEVNVKPRAVASRTPKEKGRVAFSKETGFYLKPKPNESEMLILTSGRYAYNVGMRTVLWSWTNGKPWGITTEFRGTSPLPPAAASFITKRLGRSGFIFDALPYHVQERIDRRHGMNLRTPSSPRMPFGALGPVTVNDTICCLLYDAASNSFCDALIGYDCVVPLPAEIRQMVNDKLEWFSYADRSALLTTTSVSGWLESITDPGRYYEDEVIALTCSPRTATDYGNALGYDSRKEPRAPVDCRVFWDKNRCVQAVYLIEEARLVLIPWKMTLVRENFTDLGLLKDMRRDCVSRLRSIFEGDYLLVTPPRT